ncbi:hypothetical protein [Actinopolymorpha singaporensis]|uniref:Uncharacterized protein n=1 Tax=Actinopolymorpha singaporensis TaxID=117157 RepID=A0A1H1MW71_9ACTN|nr:hypothetical protein [Actinopolymorpha singaporensis]SDR90842.1 hypothetical protein SAMN04489717_0987 [Actinopolymorpha singaporensis]
MTQDIFGLPIEAWDAIGSIATGLGVLAAGFAAAIAARQLRYNKKVEIDKNRPYVVVTFEQGLSHFPHVDILVRNVGAGPAHDVTVKVDPPLQRASEIDDIPIARARYFNDTIPLMPPGYQLRTYFDSMQERKDMGLPERYTFTIEYHDGHGHSWSEKSITDLGLHDDLLFTKTYGLHDLTLAIRGIAKDLKASALAKGEVQATIETRAGRDERRRRQVETLAARRSDFVQRRRNQSDASQTSGAGSDQGDRTSS